MPRSILVYKALEHYCFEYETYNKNSLHFLRQTYLPMQSFKADLEMFRILKTYRWFATKRRILPKSLDSVF